MAIVMFGQDKSINRFNFLKEIPEAKQELGDIFLVVAAHKVGMIWLNLARYSCQYVRIF